MIVTKVKKLRIKSTEVPRGEDVSSILTEMFVMVLSRKAAGLAAVQIGKHKRIAVFQLGGRLVSIINPVITSRAGSQISVEGCLSLPKVYPVKISRPNWVVVKGHDRHWQEIEFELTGKDAATACHEIDHLDGVLITDYK